ncbi:uncharacterized protein [Arachis hypogaea]|uniref:uncharacterized protein isoform X1 n=1 Tax=Arachis hypogaea TaxID=3818 RepID=UPI003B20C078
METERCRSSCRNLGARPVIEEDRDEGGAVNAPWWLPSPLPRFLWSKSPLMEKTPLRSRASISRQSRRSYYGCCYLAATEGPSSPIHAAVEDGWPLGREPEDVYMGETNKFLRTFLDEKSVS